MANLADVNAPCFIVFRPQEWTCQECVGLFDTETMLEYYIDNNCEGQKIAVHQAFMKVAADKLADVRQTLHKFGPTVIITEAQFNSGAERVRALN